MRAPHPYSRRRFRTRLAAWLGRNARLIVPLTLGVVVFLGMLGWLVATTMPDRPFTWWFVGVLQAGGVAAYLHLLNTAYLANDTEAIWHVRGAWGEDNTRDELLRAKRKGHIWGWVDSLELEYGDIDHLVVTRRGGLVAIDSKWRNKADDRAEMAQAARKVGLRAEGLTRDLVNGAARGSRRARVNPLSVRSVVVLWGADQDSVSEGENTDGIDFVAGRKLGDWLAALEGQPVDRAAATEVLRALRARRAAMAGARQA